MDSAMFDSWVQAAMDKQAVQIRLRIQDGWDHRTVTGQIDGVPGQILFAALESDKCTFDGDWRQNITQCVLHGLKLIQKLGVEVTDEDRAVVLAHHMSLMLTKSPPTSIVEIGGAMVCDKRVWERAFDLLWSWYQDLEFVADRYWHRTNRACDAATLLLQENNRVREHLGLPLIERSDPRFAQLSEMLMNSNGYWG